MKLSFEQIKSITTGAVRIEEEKNGIAFYRFTKEQSELYRISSDYFYSRTLATAGVRFMFKTDSRTLKIQVNVKECTSRTYFSFDVFVDGKLHGNICNFSEKDMPRNYTEEKLPLGDFSGEFDLGEGEKTVCVYFPWSVCPAVKCVEIDDNSYIKPAIPEKKLLAFGDSITQGYDALYPSGRYTSIITDKLGAQEINKGIGGEVFFPELSEFPDDFVPDYITVAYGSNDWSKKTEKDFKVRCKKFYASLSELYPNTPIFAMTPVWRKDYRDFREFGLFENVEKGIAEVVKDLKNVTLINGFDLVPHDEKYYADIRLHPNDAGYVHYADNLHKKISRRLTNRTE